MGRVGEKIGLDFVVSTGDNFYDNGLFSEHDPNFKESFSNIYTAPSLQKQWYSGNNSKLLLCFGWSLCFVSLSLSLTFK